MAHRVLQIVGKRVFVFGLGALLTVAIGASMTRLYAGDAGCADYICKADEDCKSKKCDLCGKNERCLTVADDAE